MLKKYFYLLITGILFGSQFLMTRSAIEGYSPLTVATMRIVFGMIAVTLLVPFFAKSKVPNHVPIKWYTYAWIGFLEGTLPCFLMPWGQQQVSTSISSVLISTMPIFAMFFGPLLIKHVKLHGLDILSILTGFIGVCILLNPVGGNWLQKILPEMAILLASASWALSLVFIKRLPPHQDPLRMTRNILVAATIQIIPLWLLFGGFSTFHIAAEPLWNAVLLGALCSGVVYVFYVLLIQVSGVHFAAFSNYLVPIVGCLIGFLFLKEKLNLYETIGFGVIIVGLLIQTIQDFTDKKAHLKE